MYSVKHNYLPVLYLCVNLRGQSRKDEVLAITLMYVLKLHAQENNFLNRSMAISS